MLISEISVCLGLIENGKVDASAEHSISPDSKRPLITTLNGNHIIGSPLANVRCRLLRE